MTGVSRRFGPVVALDRVDLRVPAGAVTVLLGPNGAGKTTLLRVLATLERPDAGSACVAGFDVAREPDAVRRRIGVVAHRTWLHPDLTAEENLRFHARLRGLDPSPDRLRSLLDDVGLAHRRHDRVRTFSRGTAQRLAIARAVLHDPAVLLLDEPHTGLDPEASSALDAALDALVGEGRTVLFATHDLARAAALADRLVVLDRGRVAWDGPRDAAPAADLECWFESVTAGRGRRSGPGSGIPPAGSPRRQSAPGRRDEVPRAASPGVAADRVHEPEPPAAGHAPRAVDLRPRDGVEPCASASFLGVVRAVLWKDVTVEWRTREAVPPVVMFALLVVAIFQFALGQDALVRAAAAPAALWVALLFGSTLGLGRLLGDEGEAGGAAGVLVSPVDRGAVFAGKWLAGWLFALLVAALLLPAFVALLDLRLAPDRLAALAGVIALSLVGWVAAGVVLGTMAVTTRAREVLLPVLLYPMVLPLVVPAVQATAAVLQGGGPADVAPALALVAAYDCVFWTIGFLSYGLVMEA